MVCTIAFSMGIDKSDIQSVIHYDMPKSIENYVQEIGRSGRDGHLARCHLFLGNEDFFLIRRLLLTDLLDHHAAILLTNHLLVSAKKLLLSIVEPELAQSKKRKLKSVSGNMDEFEHEDAMNRYYKDGRIKMADVDEKDIYLFIDVKETIAMLDLKREVVMTMLNSLEKVQGSDRFYRFMGVLPGSVGIRFHKTSPSQAAEQSEFIKTFIDISREYQGVFRCSMRNLAYATSMSPFAIPRLLYTLQ